ncbi:MAG: hypothetical protein WA261_03415 [Candidatus Sulfotelmatobacter sp.]
MQRSPSTSQAFAALSMTILLAVRGAEAPLFHVIVDGSGGREAGVVETSAEVPFDFAQGRLSLRSG